MMAGNAVIGAAQKALQAWKNEDRPAVATYTYQAPATYDFPWLSQERGAALALGYVAQAVEIEVDSQTGSISVQRIISAHEAGKAIHPQALTGQVQGGAVQGLGWATLEDFVVQGGWVLSTELSTYLIPTVMDVPAELEALLRPLAARPGAQSAWASCRWQRPRQHAALHGGGYGAADTITQERVAFVTFKKVDYAVIKVLSGRDQLRSS
jgi:CO/xanthine dehydrogenase Mo-binding subunit